MALNESLPIILEKMAKEIFADGIPSVEKLLEVLGKYSSQIFKTCTREIKELIQWLIDKYPREGKKALEFIEKHVIPKLLIHIKREEARKEIWKFVCDSLNRIISGNQDKELVGNVVDQLAKGLQRVPQKAAEKTTQKMSEEMIKTTGKAVVTEKTTILQEVSKATKMMIEERLTKNGISPELCSYLQKSQKTTDEMLQILEKSLSTEKVINSPFQRKLNMWFGKETPTSMLDFAGEDMLKNNIYKPSGEGARKASSELQGLAGKSASTLSKEAAQEVGIAAISKAGLTDAGISALFGAPFLYWDYQEIQQKVESGEITNEESRTKTNEKVGEYAGTVIGSGLFGAAAFFVGPVGWVGWGASVVGGALASYASGKAGEAIGHRL